MNMKRFIFAPEGQCVLYVKLGSERMACTKPWHLFDAECQLGPETTQRTVVVQRKVSEDVLIKRGRDVLLLGSTSSCVGSSDE